MQVQENLSQQSIAKSSRLPLNKGSLLFAPMEGITDHLYREALLHLYPEWDKCATDFLRVPSVGEYPKKHILKHFGEDHYKNEFSRGKTIYQILSPEHASTVDTISKIKELGFDWLDINLGCPSKTVCKNRGGSFLLSDLVALRYVINLIRTNWDNIFTAKIRVGYKDDTLFDKILCLLEEERVDAITIHARTRDEMYKGVAKWDYIKEACKHVKYTPIIGNGDIWTTDDLDKYFDYTGCHSVMIARGALKTPWLARLHKKREKDSEELRRHEIHRYFYFYNELMCKKSDLDTTKRLRRIKAISRYIFDDLTDGENIKRQVLRSKTEDELFNLLKSIS